MPATSVSPRRSGPVMTRWPNVVAAQLVAGTVSVNCHGMAAQDPRLPFGGVGQSGLGRELGVDGIRAFTQPRTFVRHPAPQ